MKKNKKQKSHVMRAVKDKAGNYIPASHCLVMGKSFVRKQKWSLYITYFKIVGKKTLTVDQTINFTTKIPKQMFLKADKFKK